MLKVITRIGLATGGVGIPRLGETRARASAEQSNIVMSGPESRSSPFRFAQMSRISVGWRRQLVCKGCGRISPLSYHCRQNQRGFGLMQKVSALDLGGRQARTDPAYGHIFDHFAIDYEYENGTHLMSMCCQQTGTDGNVSEALTGTKGSASHRPRNSIKSRARRPGSFHPKKTTSLMFRSTPI
jgi:hypothetical protein